MGYGSGVGLRPGRSIEQFTTDTGQSDDMDTTRSGRGGFRASGAVSPYREPEVRPVSGESVDGAAGTGGGKSDYADLSNYTVPQSVQTMPKAPSIGQQIAYGVGGQLLTSGISKGAEYLWNTAFPSVASTAAPVAASSGWSSVMPDATMQGAIEGTGAWGGGSAGVTGGEGATGAGMTAGKVLPYLPAAAKLVEGDVGGAAKQGAATYAGQAIGSVFGPIGTAVGGVIGSAVGGSSVVCTELLRRGDISEGLYRRELRYVDTLSPTIVRGYRFWAVPLVELMRSNPRVYTLVKLLATRFIAECNARIGYGTETILGKIVLPVCFSVCWVIGAIVGETEYQYLWEQ